MAKLFTGILSVILVVVGLFIKSPLTNLFDFICFAGVVGLGSYCLLTWRAPDACPHCENGITWDAEFDKWFECSACHGTGKRG